MNKLFKASSWLLYFLAIVDFFMIGGFFVNISGMTKGQGLAGGAMVVMYGMLFAIIALIASVVFVYYSNSHSVVIVNRILVSLFIVGLGIIIFRILTLNRTSEPENNTPKKVTAPASMLNSSFSIIDIFHRSKNEVKVPMGLGFFKPDFYKNSVLYFYSIQQFNKALDELVPMDSLGFKRTESGFEISFAPPWLMPDHLKLDYDIMYFRIQSLSVDFAEVTVNTKTQQTAYVDRNSGIISYWPDFLLRMNSVEFIKPSEQKVRVKPLSHAGEVVLEFQYMRPISIKDEWLMVYLLDTNFKQVGQGWIQWESNNQLLVSYSLLC